MAGAIACGCLLGAGTAVLVAPHLSVLVDFMNCLLAVFGVRGVPNACRRRRGIT